LNEEDIKNGHTDSYADLSITCVKKGDEEQKILEGVPKLRVNLK
jgi:hypothetical protein